MIYRVMVIDGEDAVSLCENSSVDYLVSKFIKEATLRIKKEKAPDIPTFCGKIQFHIISENMEHHGTIIGAANKNHPKGVFMVHLKGRNQILIYDIKGHLVGRDTL